MGDVRFIRKNGKIIPLGARGAVGRAGVHTARAVSVAVAAHEVRQGLKKTHPRQDIKINHSLDIAGLGISLATGVLGAVTFSGSAKKVIGGALATHAIDAVGVAANVASVAGRGHKEERAKQFARQEARNLVAGNAVFAFGLLASKTNRKALVNYGSAVLAFARKAIR